MINKRIFGTPITGSVRKKLEDRQRVAGTSDFGDSITPVFPDKDGNVQAYLSSQVPFVRMWTSVKIVEAGEVADLENSLTEVDVNTDDEDKLKNIQQNIRDIYGAEYPRLYIKPIKDPSFPSFILKYVVYNAEVSREQVDYRRRVYEIGNYAYQKEYGEVQPNESQTLQTSTATTNTTGSQAIDDILPNELIKNPLFRPQTGITSVTSETEGTLGVIKKTTINFIVNNFYDFDTIYTKYFLVPGASMFVDFGWSSISDLYNPQDLIFDKTKQGEYNNIQNFLYSEDGGAKGFITKYEGDVDVIHGIVTDYSSKALSNGSMECSVTITSSNSALMSFTPNNKIVTRIKAILSRGIMYLGIREIVDDLATQLGYDPKDLHEVMQTPNFDSPASDIETYNKNLLLLAQKQLSGRSGPEKNSIATGVFVDSLNAENSYISIGRFEDLIVNSQFGFGSNKDNIVNGGNFEVKCNSQNSFATFDTLAEEKQHVMLQVPEEAPTVLYPEFWGNSNEDVGSYSYQNDKIPTEDYEKQQNIPDKFKGGTTQFQPSELNHQKISEFDKSLNRIPIRELFINVDIIIDAFEENDSVRKALNQICDNLNEKSNHLYNIKILTGDTDAEVTFVDTNYNVSTEKDKAQQLVDPYFVFNIMSPNSIIKDYNLEFKLPQGDIGNMYAIRGMSHGSTVFSSDKSIDDAAAIGALEPDLLRIIYEPDLGTYTLENLLEEHNDGEAYNVFKSVDSLFDNNLYKVNTFTPIVAVPSPTLFGQSTPIGNNTGGILNRPLSSSADVPGVKSDEGDEPTPEDLIKINDEQATFLGYKNANTFEEYYKFKSVTETRENRPNLLPYTLSLTTYGISTIQPGDTFKVDYLPKRYIENTYLQVVKVRHNINSDGWYTTLDTQFRLRGDVKNIIYDTDEKNKILLSPLALQNAGFDRSVTVNDASAANPLTSDSSITMNDLSPFIGKVKVEYNPDARGLDYIILFKTTRKLEGNDIIKAAVEHGIQNYDGKFYIRFKTDEQRLNATNTLGDGNFKLKKDPVGYSATFPNMVVSPPNVKLKPLHEYALFVKGNGIAFIDREKDNYEKIKAFYINHPTEEEYIDPIEIKNMFQLVGGTNVAPI
jgi:hypothetical protein